MRQANGHVAILTYHRVLEDRAPTEGIEPGMFVFRSTFEAHLTALKRRFHLTSLGSVLKAPLSPSDAPMAVITFDDGWRDNMTVAWPVLARHEVPATIFLTSDYIKGGGQPDSEFMGETDVRRLARYGIEFGAHTVSHPRLTNISTLAAEEEMRRSKEMVESLTGRTCDLFAYPFGDHDAAVCRIAGSIFRGSVIVGHGWWRPGGDRTRIPRVAIHDDMTRVPAMFMERLVAAFDSTPPPV
ncbi:MAG: polysaccharide deacetylase family protein [Acidobacteriota bacterium]|nr:MAG: polysaccharide deacetylase family protein [Acidobacteriota bacterium]